MNRFPILFTYVDAVAGNRFLAQVTFRGRALAVDEGDGWWMYGVQPGDVVGGGQTFAEAREEFYKEYAGVLYDIAADAQDADGFVIEVRRFFEDINRVVDSEWRAAVDQMRTSSGLSDSLPDDLPTLPADSPRNVKVRVLELDEITAQANPQAPELALAA